MPTATAILRPNSTIAEPWSIGASPHHTSINEVVIDPAAGSAPSIGARKKEDSEEEIYGLQAVGGVDAVTSITTHTEIAWEPDEDSSGGLTVFVTIGGFLRALKFHTLPGDDKSFIWYQFTQSGLSHTQAELNSATLSLKTDNLTKDDALDVRAAYIEIIYDVSTSILQGGNFQGGRYSSIQRIIV